eukprot:11388346-Heterocapsa_arctica.AAC.1
MEWIHAQELLQSLHADGRSRTHEEMHEQDHVDDAEQRPLQEALERRHKQHNGRCSMEAPDMGTAEMGGPGLDKVGARRLRGRGGGTRRGGRSIRREREVDPEGETLSRGKFSKNQATHTMERRENIWHARQNEQEAKFIQIVHHRRCKRSRKNGRHGTRLWYEGHMMNRKHHGQNNMGNYKRADRVKHNQTCKLECCSRMDDKQYIE